MRDERLSVVTRVFFTLKLPVAGVGQGLGGTGLGIGSGRTDWGGPGTGGGRTDWDVAVRDWDLAVVACSIVLRLSVSTLGSVLMPFSTPLAFSFDCRCTCLSIRS